MGPYELISVADEECVVQVNNKAVPFRSTVVRPYYEDPDHPNDNREDPSNLTGQPSEPSEPSGQELLLNYNYSNYNIHPNSPLLRRRGRPKKNPLPKD